MKTTSLVLAIFIITISCTIKKTTANKDSEGNLIGIVSKANFEEEPYASEWFNDYYSYYETDKNIIKTLKPLLKDVKIKGFVGTWCGDSRRELPNLYKILDETDFNYKNIEIITVDRKKKANGLEKGFNIKRVPTFIFYKNDKEIGRFIEHTVNNNTIEGDFLKILSGETYKPPY